MQNIELMVGSVYVRAGKKFVAGKTYAVSDDLAKQLTNTRNERDIPFFRIVVPEDGDEVAEPVDLDKSGMTEKQQEAAPAEEGPPSPAEEEANAQAAAEKEAAEPSAEKDSGAKGGGKSGGGKGASKGGGKGGDQSGDGGSVEV